MSEYILIVIWIGFMAVLADAKDFCRTEIVCGQKVRRYVLWFSIAAFLPIIWMAGHRGDWVGDTGMYVMSFRGMPTSLTDFFKYVDTVEKDKGFYTFSAILKLIIGNNRILYFTIIAAIQGGAIIAIYRKYSISYLASVFLFVISTDYIAWMHNGIRQFLAVAIIFAATPLILKKKYVPLLLVILLASTMHRSALIMIPIVFIAQGKAWNRKTLMFIALTLLAITFVGEFTELLDSSLAETQYANVVTDYKEWQDDGTNPLRVMVYSVPTILAFIRRKTIRKLNDPLVNLYTNMSIISTGLYIISMFTSGIFMGRLPIYASLYGYLLLPWEIEHLFTPKSRKVVYLCLVGCYALYYYYQMHMVYGLF